MSTWYVDLLTGLDTNNGTSFSQRIKTLVKAATLAAPGDIVRVAGNLSTNSGTATWTKGSSLVTLSASITQLLYADGAWTRVGGAVNCSAPTSAPSPKQGSNSAKMACDQGFTSGKIAHKDIGATLNLSAYRQISLWVRSSVALASGALSINLCSDTGGNTIVNTLPLNVSLNANQWTSVTIDNGATLGSSIRSVRLTANVTLASTDVYLDNIVASKAPTAADCLTLGTLISFDNATWYHVQSINGTVVYLDAQQTTAPQTAKGFQGTTGSYTFYMLQPTQALTGNSSSVYAQTFSLNGSAGSPITISGGWNPTDMSTQPTNCWTTIDMMDWSASGVNLTGTTGYISVDRFNFTRCAFPLGLVEGARGYSLANSTCAGSGAFSFVPDRGMTLSTVRFINTTTGTTAMIEIRPLSSADVDWRITDTHVLGSTADGIRVMVPIGAPGLSISGCNCSGNAGHGFNFTGDVAGSFYNNTAKDNALSGFYFYYGMNVVGHNLVSHGNGEAQVQLVNSFVEIYGLDTNTPGGSSLPQIEFLDNSMGAVVVYNWTQYTGVSPAASLYDLGINTEIFTAPGPTRSAKIYAHRENSVATRNSIFSTYGTITTKDVVGQTGSAMAWKLSPGVNALDTSPLTLKVASIACPAGSTATLSVWAKLSAVSGVSARLRIEGGPHGIGAPGADIVTPVTGIGWVLYSISCTTTKDAVVDVFFEAFGGTAQSATVSGPLYIS